MSGLKRFALISRFQFMENILIVKSVNLFKKINFYIKYLNHKYMSLKPTLFEGSQIPVDCNFKTHILKFKL